MIVLALDTSTGAGSCAVMREGRVVREEASDPSRPQATRLPGELAALLERAAIALPDVDALAVCVGPGSFTGLRVGIAAMQGLAVALKTPLVGVSAFDALARVAARDRMQLSTVVAGTATWIDAWRGEVYAAVYDQDQPEELPVVDHPEALLARLLGRQVIFTGDGAALYAPQIRSTLGHAAHFTRPIAPLLAGAIATRAAEDLERGHRPLPHAIRPLYVRRSDAELARSAARASSVRPDQARAPRT